jgi:hypothetical protein
MAIADRLKLVPDNPFGRSERVQIDTDATKLFLALVRLLSRRGVFFPEAVVSCSRQAEDFGDEFEVHCSMNARIPITETLTELLGRPFWVHQGPWRISEAELQTVVAAADAHLPTPTTAPSAGTADRPATARRPQCRRSRTCRLPLKALS